VIDAYFRRSLITAYSSVVPDMLINLLLNLTASYIPWPPVQNAYNQHTSASFESLHPPVNFPVTRTVITCHSPEIFTIFYNLCPEESEHRSMFFFRAS